MTVGELIEILQKQDQCKEVFALWDGYEWDICAIYNNGNIVFDVSSESQGVDLSNDQSAVWFK